MRILLSAGEESGDLHGAHLARALLKAGADVTLAGMGGARMRDAGVAISVEAGRHGVVGFVEVFAKAGRLRRDLATLADACKGADALVAIDYGGFNARVVAHAKRVGLKTFYYIPPKLWAWGRHRGRELARNLDLVLAVFPFEVDFWRRAGAEALFIGHPLLDITKPARTREDVRRELDAAEGRKMLLVLPGSRISEISALWPPIARSLDVILKNRDDICAVVVPGGDFGAAALERYAPMPKGVTVARGYAVDYMAAADGAVAASGTATLELALVGTPQVILYKVNPLTWEIGRRLVYVNHLGLPNILAGKAVVAELLQGAVEPDRISAETLRALDDDGLRRDIGAAYVEMAQSLRAPGDTPEPAPARAARMILERLS